MSETCPKCGSSLDYRFGPIHRESAWICGTTRTALLRVDESAQCVKNQLTAAHARIAELEAMEWKLVAIDGLPEKEGQYDVMWHDWQKRPMCHAANFCTHFRHFSGVGSCMPMLNAYAWRELPPPPVTNSGPAAEGA
jgi:hypothetical protein